MAVRYFEYWMLRLHGLLPDLSSCGSCARDLRPEPVWVTRSADGMLCRSCVRDAGSEARELTAAERRCLAAAAELPPAEMVRHADGARDGGGLDWLLRGALESFSERKLRSYRHLGSMTAGGA